MAKGKECMNYNKQVNVLLSYLSRASITKYRNLSDKQKFRFDDQTMLHRTKCGCISMKTLCDYLCLKTKY